MTRQPQSQPAADDEMNGHSHTPSSKCNPRPSTWPIFAIYFLLPMTLLSILSNYNDILSSLGVITVSNDATPGVTVPAPSEQLHSEVTAHLERKKKERMLETNTKQKHQKNTRQKQKKKESTRPTSPQSTQQYKDMEIRISQLKSIYTEAQDTPDEIIAAIRYADYLKYRDATIHDGGTYQMEAIQVYSRAIDLLENKWRIDMLNGENTRATKEKRDDNIESGEEDVHQEGLHRELFLDIEYKSTEGLLCAAYTNLGKVYFMSNMFERAVTSYEQCLSYDTNYLDALTYRAQANVILGRYEDAGRDYTRVLRLDKERVFVDSFTGLAQVLSAKEDAVEGGWDALIDAISLELPRHTTAYEGAKSANNQIGMKHFADSLKRLHHALFKYHESKTKNSSEAWEHLQKGNEYKMSTLAPFNKLLEHQRVQALKQVFVKDFFPKGIGSKTRAPIFIIGFVRSGSTLLERILDAHPMIVGTGEDSVFNGRLDYIRNEIVTASQAGDLGILHDTVTKLADDVVDDMKKRWEIIDANSRGPSDGYGDGKGAEQKEVETQKPIRFSDKMLTNYMNVGFIHLLFPNALILHVAREPMDTIFSAYKHDFPSGGLDYTSEFEGLSQLYHSYRDVMEHW